MSTFTHIANLTASENNSFFSIQDQLEPDVEKANSKNHDGEESETCGLFPQWSEFTLH